MLRRTTSNHAKVEEVSKVQEGMGASVWYRLSDDGKKLVITTYATFALELVVGISKIIVERDMQNNASNELPSVLPLDILQTSP